MSEDTIAHRARTPKGRRTLQAILDATYELVSSEGLNATSQKAVAERAGVTQSAVRHYFPKKDDLLDAFFVANIERLLLQFREELETADKDPRSKLIRIATLHSERIFKVEDVAYFEIAAAWTRNPDYRKLRNYWYRSLSSYYRELIAAIHPNWDGERCAATAFQIITLVLGGWSTMGSSRAVYPRRKREALHAMLMDGIERLIA